MGRTASGRMSGTPDSLSDNESSPLYSRTPRKSSTPSHRSSLTPGTVLHWAHTMGRTACLAPPGKKVVKLLTICKTAEALYTSVIVLLFL